MNDKRELDNCEKIESALNFIEATRKVSANDKTILSNLLQEYFWLKENHTPSLVSAKWTEIEKVLERLKPKANQ